MKLKAEDSKHHFCITTNVYGVHMLVATGKEKVTRLFPIPSHAVEKDNMKRTGGKRDTF